MAAPEDTYAARLKEALSRDGWSQRRLAKELAARTGNAVESERSAVRGYLHDAVPRPDRAELIAEIMEDPELGRVENPRRSGAARIEDRLESLAANDAEILANQETGIQDLLAELQAIREALDKLDAAVRTQPRRNLGSR